MSSKDRLIKVVCFFIILLYRPCLAVDIEPIGWATLAGGITGGAGGEVITVTTKAGFITAVSDDIPRVVQVVGTIHGDYNIPNVGSNKTIVGIGYDARIVGFSVKVTDLDNVIVRNLTFSGAMPQDGLICRRATHVWVDHCTFFDAADGLLDFSDQCDYATVSWCKFYYTGKINPHRLTCLVGSTDDNPPDVGKLNITWHHNWWGNYADQRMPRGRYGQNHVFNNYYSCTGNSYCIGGSWGFQALVENNYFDHVDDPMRDAGRVDSGISGTFTTEIKSVGNIFDTYTGSTSTYGNAFVPAYSYTLNTAASIPSIVQAGSGTTILVGDPALWPTKATVPSPAHGECNAVVGSTLTWRAGSTAISHNVYFGTSPTELVSYGSQPGTSFTPPALTADTEYYWRIDGVAADESVITGHLWKFKTVPELPTDLYHYWPFDVDFLDVAKVFTSNPNNPFGAAWFDSNVKLLGGGCLDLTLQKDGLIAGWSDSGTNNIFPDTAPMTISLWFKPTTLPPDDTDCILGSKTGDQTSAKTFRIELLPSGACRLTVDGATPEFGNLPTINGWNHVLVSIDASGQLRAWLNANMAGSITLATSASNNYNGQYTGIGFYGDNPNGMHRGDYTGYIDDLAIWDISSDLTFAELLYSDGIGRTAIGDPEFITDPIRNLDGIELTPYTGQSLTSYADGIGTFSKESGPEWLLVSPNGTLSGSPKDANVGQNIFTVRFENTSGDSDTATMTIDVANVYSGVLGMPDLVGLAAQWLMANCTDIPVCDGADLSGDTNVDILDMDILTNNWLADESLLLYLKFDELSGNIAADGSIYERAGQLVNGPTWDTGYSGGALNFDGTDDYIEIPGYKGVSGKSSRTCTAWIKTAVAPGEILTWGNTDLGRKWIIRVNETGTLRAEVQGGYLYGTTPLTDDTWHHIGVVLDSDGTPDISEVLLYVDGQPETIVSVLDEPIDTAADQDVAIGVFTEVGVRFFNGLIDDVRIYDVALSEQEIQILSK